MNKLILQVDSSRMGKAMNAAFKVARENPQQKAGTGNGIKTPENFVVIRNQDSYTVRENR